MLLISHKKIEPWITDALIKLTLPESHARTISSALVQTSLWGIDSHGIARLPHYFNRLTRKSINPNPKFHFTRTGAGTGRFNADHGHGIIACFEATHHAIDLASESGVGAVGIYNSSHCGSIGLYTREAARRGFIALAFTHSDSFVVPYGGKKPFFGTNPISIALPRSVGSEPVCLDMATSVVPWNRIMNARRENVTVPPGLGVDSEGNDTTDPHKIIALRPLAEYKGYALAFVIDALCGPLNKMPFGPHIPKMYGDLDQHRHLGSFILLIDPERFSGLNYFREVVNRMCDEVKKENLGILFPGEPEIETEKHRSITGIPIERALGSELDAWAQRLNISPFSSL
jgi:ureidoglycolate dehydrogenase (NAD+)